MEMTKVYRTVLNISGCCNLKCKHCLAFLPYYETKWLMQFEEAKSIIDMYFKVVDQVGTFTITGGEPLLNKDFCQILEYTKNYLNQITGTIDIVTNGTLLIPDDILSFFKEHKSKARIILSDYGENLSVKIPEIEKILKEYNITYRISKLYGDDLYYNGWIDFSDHSLKWFSIEERDKHAAKCIHGAGKYFVINEGCIHRCSRSFWRIKNGIIPPVYGEYVPLMDTNVSIEEKRTILNGMMNQISTTSCAYCVGLKNDVPRVTPAIQLE